MSYQTAFDISQGPLRFEPFLGIPLLLTAVGALLVFAPRLMNTLLPGGVKGPARIVFSWFYFLFAATLSVIFLASYYTPYFSLRRTLETGQAAVTEGCLQAFHPMPMEGHQDEWFQVSGKTFSYSDYAITPAFRQTESHGGPIHADSRVRIHAVDGNIARLEVIDHACPPAARR